MKVKDLVNTCQNQWGSIFEHNTAFKIKFKFQDCENTETYNMKEYDDYGNNKTSFYLMNKRHNQEVIAWSMPDINTLQILVEEF